MSRSIKLSLPQHEVIERCQTDGVAISSSKILPLGFTQVYCKTEQGADDLRRLLADFLVIESEE